MSPIHPRTLQWRREMWSTRMVRYTFGFLWHLKTRCLETSDYQIRWVFRKWMDEIWWNMMKSVFHPFSVPFPMAKPPGSIQRNRMDWVADIPNLDHVDGATDKNLDHGTTVPRLRVSPWLLGNPRSGGVNGKNMEKIWKNILQLLVELLSSS